MNADVSRATQVTIVTDQTSLRDEDRIEGPQARCPVCHQQVPEGQMAPVSGRLMCFCCASAWFTADDEEE